MRKYIPLLFLLVILVACSKNTTKPTTTPEFKMQQADAFYKAKKYAKAYPLYQQIVFERNSAIAADAQMKLAQSYFYLHKFSEAELEYEQMIKLFPDYENISLAYFQIGVCYMETSPKPQYTQEDTQKAIEAFQTFIDKYPNDKLRPTAIEYLQKAQNKLLEKNYNNGYIYYKMADYSAALLYFNEITVLANHDRLERMSLYYSTKIHINRGNWELANQTFKSLSKNFPTSKETQKIRQKLTRKNQLK